MDKPTVYVTVGKIDRSYGVSGWLKIQTYMDSRVDLLKYSPWYVSREEQRWEEVRVQSGRVQNNALIVKFEGIETPEEAKLLSGKWVALARSQLPKLNENEYYWSDLIGLTVINKQGKNLGKVIYLIETGSNDVLVVKGQKEHAIPYLFGSVILKVDLEKQEIQVEWEPI